MSARLVVCLDVGSTYTKGTLVELAGADSAVLATVDTPTTTGTDVLEGVAETRAHLAQAHPDSAAAKVLACSSAGGGLRIAVVGNEVLVTAEAGRRVALSSGGRVVHISAGCLDQSGLAEMRSARPDVVLLTGGTDGGNAEVLLHNADFLRASQWQGPVVAAGNAEVRDQVGALLDRSRTPVSFAANLVPRIGVLAPQSARAAIREMFLSHVIGGKRLSRGPGFAQLVRGATPDLILAGVELLAQGLDEARPGVGDVLVVDVGGATTDVYSVRAPSEEYGAPGTAHLSREVVASTSANRTVEGDLGMRSSAPSTVEEALAAGLVAADPADDRDLADALSVRRQAVVRAEEPTYLPRAPQEWDFDADLASWAVALAVRRHAGRSQVRIEEGGHGVVDRTGIDLREVRLLVGSGGALRHSATEGATGGALAEAPPGGRSGGVATGKDTGWQATGRAATGRVAVTAREILSRHLDGSGGWQVPEAPSVIIDSGYLLLPAGLLAETEPEAAYALLAPLREAAVT